MRKNIVLIVCILIVILALALLVVSMLGGSSSDQSVNTEISENYEPEIEYTTEILNGNTIIYIEATIDGGYSIESIILPDGDTVNGSNAEYEATESGEYEFEVIASNGTSKVEVISVENIEDSLAYLPYIPDGFTHVSDTEVETGYIITDEFGNEFVWVPVGNGTLTRNTDENEQFEESDTSATEFCNSVAKYYGFYIARYEASQNIINEVATVASIKDATPWSNITYVEAYEVSRKHGKYIWIYRCKNCLDK